MSLHGLGIQEWMKPGIVNRPGGTGDYLFMFFYDETEIRHPDGSVVSHPPGAAVCWTPDSGHYYGNPAKRWRHTWLHCDGALVRRQLTREKIPCNLPFISAPAPVWEKYFSDLHTEATRYQTPDPVILKNALQSFLREISRGLTPPPENRTRAAFDRLRQFLETNFEQKITLAQMAEMTHLSPSHFSTEFRRLFGVPPVDYLIRLRLRQAAYLLPDHNLSVGEIASRVGYEDIYQFSKIFKKHFGHAPSALRKTNG